MNKYRTEKDSIGEIQVFSGKYWGAQTQRAIVNFQIGDQKMPIEVIYALVLIKKAAAQINNKLGLLSKDIATAIIQSADEILSGQRNDNFPLLVWQSGSGTQTNMNVNEVLANRAIEIMGGIIGSKIPVHANDHVNMSQSSNDTFSTAMHIAAIESINKKLLPQLKRFLLTLENKSKEFHDIIKIGRTHLQDAVPMTLGQEFATYASQIKSCIRRINNALESIIYIPQGGSAIGTGINVHNQFANMISTLLSTYINYELKSADNKFEGIATHDSIVEVSSALNVTAVSLMKIVNDIRLLSSGPRCGIGEIILPFNEPGSSIMPGKVNPTQCEALAMVCAQVIGNHTTITVAGSHGHLQLNTFGPVMILNLLQSINLLDSSINNFIDKCLVGISANISRINELVNKSLMLATILNKHIGYDNATKLVQYAYLNNTSLRDAALTTKIIEIDKFDELVMPQNML